MKRMHARRNGDRTFGTLPDDGAERTMVDEVHPDIGALYARRGLDAPAVPFPELVWTWGTDRALHGLADDVIAYDLDEHVAWWNRGPRDVQPALKQLSFVFRRAELSVEEFRRHYREHIDVAWEHHVGCCRYVQNDVVARHGEDAPAADGFSELWFENAEDYVERYYTNGADSAAAVRADTSEFIDFSRTFSVLVTDRAER